MKINFYIDGFNLYHALNEYIQKGENTENYLKWFSMKGVCQSLLIQGENLNELFYFSSPPTHKKQSVQMRHQKFMQAITGTGVKVIEGQFKKRHDVECDRCHHSWPRHDEKETDVNLAVKVIVDAFEGRFDKCLIVSNDTDMKSVAEVINKKFPHLEYICVTPIDVEKRPFSIINPFHLSYRTITIEHIRRNILPEMTPDGKGGLVKRPAEYIPTTMQEFLLQKLDPLTT